MTKDDILAINSWRDALDAVLRDSQFEGDSDIIDHINGLFRNKPGSISFYGENDIHRDPNPQQQNQT